MYVNTQQIGQFGICRLNWNDIGDPCVRPTTIQVSKAIQVAQIRWLTQMHSFRFDFSVSGGHASCWFSTYCP